MRRFVRIDAGVLDQNFLSGCRALPRSIDKEKSCRFLTIEPGIDVSSTGNFKFLKPRNLSQSGHNLFRNFAWSLTQLFGQFKTQRQSIFAQPDIRRLVNHNPGQFNVILPLQKVADALDKLLL